MVRENQVIRAGLFCLLVLSNQVYAYSAQDFAIYIFLPVCGVGCVIIAVASCVMGGIPAGLAVLVIYPKSVGISITGTAVAGAVVGKTVKNLISDKSELQAQVNQLTPLANTTTQALQNASTLQQSNTNLVSRVTAQDAQITDLQQANRDLVSQVATQNAEIIRLDTANTNLVSQVATQNAEIIRLDTANTNLVSQVTGLQQANRDVEARMEARMEARFAAIQACSISDVQTRSSTRTNSLVDSVSSSPAGFSILS